MENYRCTNTVIGSNKCPLSVEKIEVYKYPQGGSLVGKAFQVRYIQDILPNFVVSALLKFLL